MEVDYLPDSGGPIVKNGHSKMVPSTKVNPIREVQGPLPNTNIRRTRSRVKIAIWISIIAMITVLGFFVMGVVWLWQIEQREYEQADTIDNLEREIGDERLTIEQLKKAVEGSRSINIHEVNPCFLPKLVGACKKAELKWYYDQETRKCQQFKYGGCEGNKNNFESKAECQEMCAVSQNDNDNDNVNDNDIDIVNDNDNEEDINNKNQDVAIDDSNPCDLSMDVGHCRAAFPRFYFDKETGNCKKFIYGGCAGNSNNFETLDECQARCKPTKPKQNEPTKPNQPTKPNDEVCNLEPESGMCRGAYERYFYDKKTESCKQFNWGGCGGNGNNFETKIACRKACPEGRNNVDLNPDAICSLPSRTGTCRAAMQRYFYNAQTLKCELFIYGGCEGNDNNFKTEEECRSFCSGN